MKITKQISLSAAALGAAATLTSVSASADTSSNFIGQLSEVYSMTADKVGSETLAQVEASANNVASSALGTSANATSVNSLGDAYAKAYNAVLTVDQTTNLDNVVSKLAWDLTAIEGYKGGQVWTDFMFIFWDLGLDFALSWANTFLVTELVIGFAAGAEAAVSLLAYGLAAPFILDIPQLLIAIKFAYDIASLVQITGFTQEAFNLVATLVTYVVQELFIAVARPVMLVGAFLAGLAAMIPIVSWIGGAIAAIIGFVGLIGDGIIGALVFDMVQGAHTNLTSIKEGFGVDLKVKSNNVFGENIAGWVPSPALFPSNKSTSSNATAVSSNADAVSSTTAVSSNADVASTVTGLATSATSGINSAISGITSLLGGGTTAAATAANVDGLSDTVRKHLAAQSSIDQFAQMASWTNAIHSGIVATHGMSGAFKMGTALLEGLANMIVIGWPFAGAFAGGELTVAHLIQGVAYAIAGGALNWIAVPQALNHGINQMSDVFGEDNATIKELRSSTHLLMGIGTFDVIINIALEIAEAIADVIAFIPIISIVPSVVSFGLSAVQFAWNMITGVGRILIVEGMNEKALKLLDEPRAELTGVTV